MKTCPKCSYTRMAADAKVPDWQCPKCGIAYAKFETQQVEEWAAKKAVPLPAGASMSSMPVKSLFFILAGLVAAGYVGYQRYTAEKMQDVAEYVEKAPSGGQMFETSNPAYYGTQEADGIALRLKREPRAQLQRMTPASVVMFATSWCPYCAKARAVFAKQGVGYTELNVEADSRAASFQHDVMGMQGVPTIVIGNRVVQGFDEGAIVAALKAL